MQIEQRAVAAHEVNALVVAHPPERRLRPGRARDQRDTGVARKVPRLDEVDDPFREQLVDGVAVDLELDEATPARIAGGQLVAVLVGVETDDARLQPQRKIFGDDGDGVALVGQVLRHGEDAMVVVVRRERGRQSGGVLMVQLDAQRAARGIGDERLGERARLRAELLEHPEGLPRRPAELRVIALRLELHQHDDGEHHLVLVEAHERSRIGEEHGGVEDVRAQGARGYDDCRFGHGYPTGSGATGDTVVGGSAQRGITDAMKPLAPAGGGWSTFPPCPACSARS